MRPFCLSLVALLSSCTTPARHESSNLRVVVQYKLSIFTWNANRAVIGKGVENAFLAGLPPKGELGKLLHETNSREVQILARCEIQGSEFRACRQLRVSPNTSTVAKRATALLLQLKINSISLNQSITPPNQATFQMRIAMEGAQRETSQDCILPSFCGIPIPAAPLPPSADGKGAPRD